MDLKLEQIIRHADGYTITHKRAKQRSDKKFTKFLVPQDGGMLIGCLSTVPNEDQQATGRVQGPSLVH
jgi:hypothetical protein